MSSEARPPYRFYRPRRPGGMGEGLRLEGMSSTFGLIGIAILILVGCFMVFVTNIPKQNELFPIDIELTAPPYLSSKFGKTALLPVTRARVMSLQAATFAAVDSSQLFALAKGEKLLAWLTMQEAKDWNEGVGRKDFYTALLLQKKNGAWLVDYKSYRSKAGKFGSQGWWIILFGLLLVPYQLLQKPKVPIWVAILLYIFSIVVWNVFV